MSDENRIMRMENTVKELEGRLKTLENALFDNNGIQGLIAQFKSLWEDFWRWHDETWIEFLSKERRESCFYIREKKSMRESKKFSMAKFAFVTKEIAQIVGILILILKVFKIMP